MNRDNLLFVVIGLLVGFIAGYLLQESLAARQPPRLPAATGAAMGGAMPGAAPGAGPAMEEVRRLREYVEANPQDADAILLLANMNYDIRNWQGARELYERYLALRPNDPDVITDLGVALRSLGEFDAALAQFDEAQRIQDGHWQSLFNEVVVLAFDLGDYARAEPILQRLRTLQPDNQEVERLAAEVARRRDAA